MASGTMMAAEEGGRGGRRRRPGASIAGLVKLLEQYR